MSDFSIQNSQLLCNKVQSLSLEYSRSGRSMGKDWVAGLIGNIQAAFERLPEWHDQQLDLELLEYTYFNLLAEAPVCAVPGFGVYLSIDDAMQSPLLKELPVVPGQYVYLYNKLSLIYTHHHRGTVTDNTIAYYRIGAEIRSNYSNVFDSSNPEWDRNEDFYTEFLSGIYKDHTSVNRSRIYTAFFSIVLNFRKVHGLSANIPTPILKLILDYITNTDELIDASWTPKVFWNVGQANNYLVKEYGPIQNNVADAIEKHFLMPVMTGTFITSDTLDLFVSPWLPKE